MQKKWKKTGAALLIAGLTVTGTGYALADEKAAEIIDLSQLGKETVEESPVSPVKKIVETTETDANKDDADTETSNVTDPETNNEDVTTETDNEESKDESVKVEVTENELPEIPEGYTAGNLAALAKAYEQAGNPTAKAAIKRNMERAIAKWESKQPVLETPEVEVKGEVLVTVESTKVEELVKEDTVIEKTPVQEETQVKVKAKNPQAELNAKHKEQREDLKAVQKAEREVLKQARKAAKELEKQEKKEKKN
ncbi:hypothetical protein [Sporosarcina highlanderae]|uniref:Uncharacterized protein n=1 Tax=Sporosarcina highlanderae TaxID=3035916 RepID=A0ABT8JTN3_9BACL|nr:hypothetical protein [Sporosarcina highlanderae]MDN4608526.1 hypothetical protein [Sporosarcina highlanderae]